MSLTGVVIVNYMRDQESVALVEFVTKIEGVSAANVVLVNNGPASKVLAGMDSAVTRLDLPNPGYGAAINRGVRELPEDLTAIVVLTHDAVIPEGSVVHLVTPLFEDERTGLVGPTLVDSRFEDRIWSVGGTQTRLRRLPKHLTQRSGDGPALAPSWLDGSIFAIRREDFVAIGGYDETYFLYFEDVDLGHRIRSQLGKQLVCLQGLDASQSPGGHMTTFLAVRNMLWLLKDQDFTAARMCFCAETVVRVVVGPLMRPRGGSARSRARFRGLVAGLRRPPRKFLDLR